MCKTRQIHIWTIRNRRGQFIATYRAYTADQAISRVIDEQMATASTFRKSQPLTVKREDFVASIEIRL